MGQTGNVAHVDMLNEATKPERNTGTLEAGGEEYSVEQMSDSESISKGVDQFLQEANTQEALEPSLAEHTFSQVTPELANTEQEIHDLHQLVEQLPVQEEVVPQEQPRATNTQTPKHSTPLKQSPQEAKPPLTSTTNNRPQTAKPEPVYSSLFSLAHSVNTSLTNTQKSQQSPNQPPTTQQNRENNSKSYLSFAHPNQFERADTSRENQFEKNKEGRDQQQGKNQEDSSDQQKKKDKALNAITNVKTDTNKTSQKATLSADEKTNESLDGLENVYIRFMALMARILGQAEAEAHELYNKIKERTDNVDVLTLLLSKINSEKEGIDWTNNDEMKALLEKARQIGVDIPEGTCSWSEEEKKLLKENIQMRKDSMEKMTQLERTDMQRYLQEASQCHQARSNVLKLLKEVMDTIIHNMRP